MPCLNDDGTLSPPGRAILKAMAGPVTLEDVAGLTDLPLYRIRSSIRELTGARLIEEVDGRFAITMAGRLALAAAEAGEKSRP